MKLTKFAAIAAVAIIGCTSCFAFAGCGEDPGTSQGDQQKEATVVGMWKLDVEQLVQDQFKAQTGSEVSKDSAEFKQAMELLKQMMGDITFDLKADGSAVLSAEIGGQKNTSNGNYTVDGEKIVITDGNGNPQEFTFKAKENTLTGNLQGQTIILKKA